MIKKLFNNPWFVACMGGFAMIYLGMTVVVPMVFDDAPVPPEVDPLDFAQAMEVPGELSAAQGHRPMAASASPDDEQTWRKSISWLEDVGRDPFATSELTKSYAAEVAQELPKVVALFYGKGVQAAVVNNKLVHVGDQVEEFWVDAIDEDYVVLRHLGVLYRLEPEV